MEERKMTYQQLIDYFNEKEEFWMKILQGL